SGSPCATLQHAVNVALPGEEVRAAAGTYSGAETVGVVQWNEEVYTYTQVVFIDKELTLRGGYSPSDWDTSNPTAFPTIIDPQGHGRGISVVAPGGSVTVDGFTITGGDYTGLGNPPGAGYTVCRENESVDCGGGVYANRSTLILRNSVVAGNLASRNRGVGSGVYLWEVYAGTRIENTTVISNSALGAYGGGGMYADRIYGPMTIAGSTFQDNYAAGAGGGMLLYDVDALVTIEDTDFLDNTAASYEGGGAHIRPTDNGEMLRMDRVRFEGNHAHERAAALYIHAAANVIPHATLTNLVFGDNSTTETTASDAVIGIEGRFTSLGVDLAHVTAANNQAPTFLYAEPASDPGDMLTVTLTNTLLASFANAFAAREWTDGDVVIRHVNTLRDDVTTLHQTVDGSPTFEAVNTLSGDPKLDVDYRLLSGSAAIDAGVDAGVTTDIDGQTRPYGAGADIGADEFVPIAAESVSIVGPTTGFVGRSYAFEAVVSPPAATGPFTYNWSPGPDEGQGTHRAVYRWTSAGSKSIAVTATSPLGTTPPGGHEIAVERIKVYLPLVVRQ
ncbi:MAG: choice-of-anchor Q domain-containing protein, partial [Anaerolineae bacterium]